MKREYAINSEAEKRELAERIAAAPFKSPFVVVANFQDDRTLDQNALIQPVVREIARHMENHGAQKRSQYWWRHYFLAKYRGQEVIQDPDGSGGIIVMNKEDGTSRMSKKKASEFIEWLYAFGSNIGVEWPE